MITVMKAIIILLLQIIIYYLFGSLLELICRKKHGMVFKVISGFLTYQIIFHICALPMIKMDQTLTRLTILWLLMGRNPVPKADHGRHWDGKKCFFQAQNMVSAYGDIPTCNVLLCVC